MFVDRLFFGTFGQISVNSDHRFVSKALDVWGFNRGIERKIVRKFDKAVWCQSLDDSAARARWPRPPLPSIFFSQPVTNWRCSRSSFSFSDTNWTWAWFYKGFKSFTITSFVTQLRNKRHFKSWSSWGAKASVRAKHELHASAFVHTFVLNGWEHATVVFHMLYWVVCISFFSYTHYSCSPSTQKLAGP